MPIAVSSAGVPYKRIVPGSLCFSIAVLTAMAAPSAAEPNPLAPPRTAPVPGVVVPPLEGEPGG